MWAGFFKKAPGRQTGLSKALFLGLHHSILNRLIPSHYLPGFK